MVCTTLLWALRELRVHWDDYKSVSYYGIPRLLLSTSVFILRFSYLCGSTCVLSLITLRIGLILCANLQSTGRLCHLDQVDLDNTEGYQLKIKLCSQENELCIQENELCTQTRQEGHSAARTTAVSQMPHCSQIGDSADGHQKRLGCADRARRHKAGRAPASSAIKSSQPAGKNTG